MASGRCVFLFASEGREDRRRRVLSTPRPSPLRRRNRCRSDSPPNGTDGRRRRLLSCSSRSWATASSKHPDIVLASDFERSARLHGFRTRRILQSGCRGDGDRLRWPRGEPSLRAYRPRRECAADVSHGSRKVARDASWSGRRALRRLFARFRRLRTPPRRPRSSWSEGAQSREWQSHPDGEAAIGARVYVADGGRLVTEVLPLAHGFSSDWPGTYGSAQVRRDGSFEVKDLPAGPYHVAAGLWLQDQFRSAIIPDVRAPRADLRLVVPRPALGFRVQLIVTCAEQNTAAPILEALGSLRGADRAGAGSGSRLRPESIRSNRSRRASGG